MIRPASAADVVDAVAYARTQDVPLSVRSGGHGISGRSTNDGGIVIDMSGMNKVEVLDRATRGSGWRRVPAGGTSPRRLPRTAWR